MEIEKLAALLVVITAVFVALDAYALYRWIAFVKRRGWKKIFIIAPVVIAIIMFALLAGNNFYRLTNSYDPITVAILIVVSIWYLPKLLITPVIAFFDLLRFVKHKMRSKHERHNETPRVIKTRREFVKTAGWAMSGVPFIMTGKGALINATDIKIHSVQIPFFNDGIHPEIKIAQLSDLHLGSFINKDPVIKAINYIKEIKPDILLLTGDFVNFHPSELRNGLDEFSKLDLPLGIWGCMGNHDHYMTSEYHTELKRLITKAGVKLLVNESQVIDYKGVKFNLAGVDNYSKRQKFGDFGKTYAQIDDRYPTLLMCHDPWNWDRNILPVKDIELTLAGHTHGGQIALDVLGSKLSFVSLSYKYYAGLYKEDGKYIYVNRGLGTSGPPVRLGVNPELTVLRLVSKANLAHEKVIKNINNVNSFDNKINIY